MSMTDYQPHTPPGKLLPTFGILNDNLRDNSVPASFKMRIPLPATADRAPGCRSGRSWA